MNKRPLSITVISWIFIALGVFAIVSVLVPLFTAGGIQRLAALKERDPFEFWIIPSARLLAGLSGLFMLYGINWARWLLVAWLGYHIILNIFHSPFRLLMHIVLFAVLLYFLFRPLASAYFRGTKVEPQIPIQS